MALTFNPTERRVLGVLVEKALAQPQYYPMTLNAIVVACNQKNNRDPLMELDEESVWNTLEVLRAGGLVSRLLPGMGSRVDRYKHELKERLGWEKPQRAVLCELLLRGPQTPAELRTRCERMIAIDGPELINGILDGLARTDPPLVAPLPRQPGQSATRYTHLLYPEGEQPAISAPPAASHSAPAAATSSVVAPTPHAPAPHPADGPAERSSLSAEMENLQAEMAEMHQAIAALRRRIERIEGDLGLQQA
ncbi:hypothetical protein RAS1_28490 [Phycisphaerae bacterium RAS1]|nr:hypothetical protein RAS1_28490 [Phycisphaerae bacterium RAS1]